VSTTAIEASIDFMAALLSWLAVGEFLAGCEAASLDRRIPVCWERGCARNRHSSLYRQRLGSGVPVAWTICSMYRHRKLLRADHIGYLVSVRASRSLTDIGLNMPVWACPLWVRSQLVASQHRWRLRAMSRPLPGVFRAVPTGPWMCRRRVCRLDSRTCTCPRHWRVRDTIMSEKKIWGGVVHDLPADRKRRDTKPSAADARRARPSVVTHPAQGVAVEGELVAVGFPIHPARPALAEPIGLYPPSATIGGAIASGKRRSHAAHLAAHAAAGRVTDGQLEAWNFEVDSLATHGITQRVARKRWGVPAHCGSRQADRCGKKNGSDCHWIGGTLVEKWGAGQSRGEACLELNLVGNSQFPKWNLRRRSS